MNKIEIWIIAVILIGLSSRTLCKIADIDHKLESGSHLQNVKVQAYIAADAPWDKLPVFIKEDMAKSWSGNKLEKSELIEMRDYYEKKIATMPDKPVSIAEDFKEGRLMKEVTGNE